MKDIIDLSNYSIIKHIPHASTLMPEDMVLPISFKKYIYKMADLFVDELFKSIPGIEVKAPYSRIFCDVERYKDDNLEPMAKLGQGYIYTSLYNNIKVPRTDECKKHAEEYYDEHHSKLKEIVATELKKGKKVLILDLHSYSDEQANLLGKTGPYPDICIGVNQDFANKPLLYLLIRIIKDKGYSYQINYPYSGSIIPSNYQSNKEKVESIMIEVNKRLYL